MIKRKKKFFFISALHSLRHGHKKNKLIFIAPLPGLRYDHKKISFFNFTTTFTMQISSYILLRYQHVAKVSTRYPPQKNIRSLKTFFLRNFSGVLHDLLRSFLPLLPNVNYSKSCYQIG